jgi:hypothetical protein
MKWFLLMGDGRKMEKAGEGGAGGGAPDPKDQLIADLSKRLEALETKSKGDPNPDPKPAPKPDDDDLKEKARKQRESDDKKNSDSKALENALKFSLKADEFLKTNAALLPKEVADIFKAAEKETYSNAIEKDEALKSGLIQTFFSVQANVDLLTPGLKSQLDDYLKLTKTGKQEKAQQIYDSIFEPAFEMLRREKKAEELRKGYGTSSSTDDDYKKKLMGLSRKHYLGEKKNDT